MDAVNSEDGNFVKWRKKSAATKKRISYLSISVSLSYSSFLVSTSTLKSYPEAITAVLPCFWSYAEIAEVHKDKLKTNKNQLYKDWANAYLSDSYLHLVEKIKDLVNEAGKNFPYHKLKEVFANASRYEYLFWDAAYHKTIWPDS